MNAPTLFDAPETQGRSRKSDPQTSVDAAKTVKAGTQRALLLDWLRLARHHGVTADEMQDHYPHIHRSTWATRLSGMARDGLVYVRTTHPNRAGRRVQVFCLTEKGEALP